MFILTIWFVKYTLHSYKYIRLIPLIPKPRFLDLQLPISNDIVSTKMYDKRDDFNFEIVNFSILDGDIPRSTSYGFISLSLSDLLENLATLLTSTLAINC